MDLKTEILNAHSKANTVKIMNWIGEDVAKIDALVELFLMEDIKLVQRSSWVITSLAEAYPEGMERHLSAVVDRMVDDRFPVGVRRNMIRSLQFMTIPTSLQGVVLQACFSFLENPKEGNVVQVFAMSVIERLTKEFPELIPELIYRIERNLENTPSPAFNNRAQKTLKRLRRPSQR